MLISKYLSFTFVEHLFEPKTVYLRVFGFSIFRELSRFIAAGRLHCKVDRVGGVVETNRPDSKNWQYQAMVKQGDLLLNRVQKLSRVINI